MRARPPGPPSPSDLDEHPFGEPKSSSLELSRPCSPRAAAAAGRANLNSDTQAGSHAVTVPVTVTVRVGPARVPVIKLELGLRVAGWLPGPDPLECSVTSRLSRPGQPLPWPPARAGLGYDSESESRVTSQAPSQSGPAGQPTRAAGARLRRLPRTRTESDTVSDQDGAAARVNLCGLARGSVTSRGRRPAPHGGTPIPCSPLTPSH